MVGFLDKTLEYIGPDSVYLAAMTIDKLIDTLTEHYKPEDKELIQRAYEFAARAHADQKRASGEPYVTHCVAVAGILADLNLSPFAISAGLLHDTIEDTDVTLAQLTEEFGPVVSKMVDGVTKLSTLPRVSRDDQRPDTLTAVNNGNGNGSAAQSDDARKRALAQETLRKTFLAMSEDTDVVLIKLADRLHNMRTLHFLPEAKRRRIAQQTLDIFAPLANRLGIWQIKWELEDLAFRYVNPEKYREISELLATRRTDREKQIKDIVQKLHDVMEQEGIKAEISGRPKHIYSIYKKMEGGRSFDSLMDLRGVRLIVEDKQACYAALGIIHSHWKPISREFDDYIAVPKDNMYQSLHTAVIYDDGKSLEVQIRTLEMHRNAEYGIAAHWRYKEKHNRVGEAYQQRVNWLRRMREFRNDVTDPQEFVEGMKNDIFKDRVYVFTPRGDIIDLPSGATPIDFAYNVHTDVGHRCRGAKVNGKLVTLDYVLKTGDSVEIITARQGGPSRDWMNANLKLVNTQRARSKIRAWFKDQDREQNLVQGKALLDREVKRLGLEFEAEAIARAMDYRTTEDFYIAIGCGDVTMGRIINLLSDLSKENSDTEETLQPTEPSNAMYKESSISVLGLRGMLTTFARCCNPAQGDDILGYITRGRGVTIHRQDCPNILRLNERERIIKVNWGTAPKTYPVPVEIKAYDRQGLMGDISTVLGDEGINMIDFHPNRTHNLVMLKLVLEIDDIAQLSRVLTRIEALPNVMEAYRVRGG